MPIPQYRRDGQTFTIIESMAEETIPSALEGQPLMLSKGQMTLISQMPNYNAEKCVAKLTLHSGETVIGTITDGMTLEWRDASILISDSKEIAGFEILS